MTSSAGTSRRMVIALEKTLAERDIEILSLKASIKLAEEKAKVTEDKLRRSAE